MWRGCRDCNFPAHTGLYRLLEPPLIALSDARQVTAKTQGEGGGKLMRGGFLEKEKGNQFLLSRRQVYERRCFENFLDFNFQDSRRKMDTAAMVLAPQVDVGDRIDRYTIRRVIHGARDIVVCEVSF